MSADSRAEAFLANGPVYRHALKGYKINGNGGSHGLY